MPRFLMILPFEWPIIDAVFMGDFLLPCLPCLITGGSSHGFDSQEASVEHQLYALPESLFDK
jgi:hypothetical protein